MEFTAKDSYNEVQVRKWLARSGIDPIKIIVVLLNEKRFKDRVEIAYQTQEDVAGVLNILGLNERTYYHRLITHGVDKDRFKDVQKLKKK